MGRHRWRRTDVAWCDGADGGASGGRAIRVEEVGRGVHLSIQVIHAAAAAEAAATHKHAAVGNQHCAAVVRAGHCGRSVRAPRLRYMVPDLCIVPYSSAPTHSQRNMISSGQP